MVVMFYPWMIIAHQEDATDSRSCQTFFCSRCRGSAQISGVYGDAQKLIVWIVITVGIFDHLAKVHLREMLYETVVPNPIVERVSTTLAGVAGRLISWRMRVYQLSLCHVYGARRSFEVAVA